MDDQVDRVGRGAAVTQASLPVPPALAQSPPASGGAVDAGVIEDLVAGSRILADQGVLDGFGHVSIRHPATPRGSSCRARWRRR